MRIGSLFAGIGGFDLGLERSRLGHVVWQVEIDPFCSSVLAKHWPEVKRYGDVRTVGAHNLEPVDVLCGGFPCQDVSVAGKQAGLDGERSGLWFEYLRIVRELAPRVVLVENVAHTRARWLCAVRQGLHELGYRTSAYNLAAKDVGAPHARRRTFVAAYADSKQVRLEQQRRSARQPKRVQNARHAEPVDAGAALWGGPIPALCRVDDGLCRGLDEARIAALGNAVVPAVAEVVGRIVLEELKR